MKKPLRCLLILILPFLLGQSAVAKKKRTEAPAAGAVAGLLAGSERLEGPLTVHLDRKAGKVWLELPPLQEGAPFELLYTESLLTGLGSNPVGLDRGQLGETKWVRFRRVGSRLLIEQPNLSYRAITDNPDEARAVEHSFATSVLWSGTIEAEEGDRAVIDFTSFLVRDAHGVVATLQATDQGSFSLAADRSVVDFDRSLAFPRNLELEAILTFTGRDAGRHVRSTAPDASAITLVQHHSFVALPEPGYEPRRLDPRAGSFGIDFLDYAVPLDEPMRKQWLVRHRLEKVDPSAARSPVVEPIVYYVDSGAPEPIRSALIEGASWWADAFEAAGFQDAFRVEVLPPDAHPLDVRYNVIQWVHRSTRGWSYGGGVVDPRTGEMLKGHVSLGSLRVRQDIRIFEGLLGAEATGGGGAADPVELALARIRQLSAHEVGHTLGFAHNFAASTYDGRASVMDYPAPWVRADEAGGLDVSAAYGVGVGSWDHHTVRYAYSQMPPGVDESEQLAGIVQEGIANGLHFLSDADARAPGSAHPLANLWDNGVDPVEELANVLEVRRRALAAFDTDRVATGRPLAELEEVLAPIYFYHRFQVEAAARALGGVDYSYSLRGDGQGGPRPLDASRQWRALELLLAAVEPGALDLPEELLALLAPRPFTYWRHRELFDGRTYPLFDPLAAAASASDLVFSFVLQEQRLARLVDHHRRNSEAPSVEAVLQRVADHALADESKLERRQQEIARVTQRVLVDRLIRLLQGQGSPEVQYRVRGFATSLAERLDVAGDKVGAVHRRSLRDDLRAALEAPSAPRALTPSALDLPPGSPIGDSGWEWQGPPIEEQGCSWN